jgi:hypothetical protein
VVSATDPYVCNLGFLDPLQGVYIYETELVSGGTNFIKRKFLKIYHLVQKLECETHRQADRKTNRDTHTHLQLGDFISLQFFIDVGSRLNTFDLGFMKIRDHK